MIPENLNIMTLPSPYPGASAALGADFWTFYALTDMILVAVQASPSVDDADATLAIEDDGTAVVAAFSCADADVPGTWKTTIAGGTETPVRIAAGSKISLTATGTANGTSILTQIAYLIGSTVE